MSDFKAKMQLNRIWLGLLLLYTVGELAVLPKPPSWNKGDGRVQEGGDSPYQS